MPDEKVYQVALHLLSGIGSKTAKQLVSHCESASNVFNISKKQLLTIPGVGEKNVNAILNAENAMKEAEKELELAAKLGCRLLFYTDDAFPKRLNGLYDSPVLLYCKGNVNLNSTRMISIVGTRNATEYGKQITSSIIASLKAIPELIIVSGLAYGIDIYAHRASLQYQIPTVGVMASGADIMYPARHKGTAVQMQENGAIITEERISTAPEAHRFPARNRIIAGMTDCTLVVEGAIKGGALITARIANSYNREVFAIPGNVNNTYSAGCNFLIKNHEAHLVTSAKDICDMMNWEMGEKVKKQYDFNNMTVHEQKIMACLVENNSIEIDELSRQTEMPMHEISVHLLNLELQQVVKVLPGKKYALQ